MEEQTILAELRSTETKSRAFGQLVQLHQEMLYHHVRRLVIDHDDADDVLQNTFVKAWRHIDSFRADSKIRTWLFRIATNEALTFLEKKKKQQFTDIENIQDDLRHSLAHGPHIDGDEIQMKLQQAILTLPDRQRTVFHLRYFDEMPYEEISQILEVTTGSLKASYHHAVKKIEAFLTARTDAS
ncbi:MAG: RNA polymerase sigma factor [Bacteroidia bacterium]|nr:RNA polymerase sigma factor [Bacteroidia bacterium]